MRSSQPNQPPAAVAKRLKRLVERRYRTDAAARTALEELHLAVHEAHQAGASDRGIGAAIGVPEATVRSWRKAGEARAGHSDAPGPTPPT